MLGRRLRTLLIAVALVGAAAGGAVGRDAGDASARRCGYYTFHRAPEGHWIGVWHDDPIFCAAEDLQRLIDESN